MASFFYVDKNITLLLRSFKVVPETNAEIKRYQVGGPGG